MKNDELEIKQMTTGNEIRLLCEIVSFEGQESENFAKGIDFSSVAKYAFGKFDSHKTFEVGKHHARNGKDP